MSLIRDAILREVAEHYHQALAGNTAALGYLGRRGLADVALVARFRIGYCAGDLRSRIAPDSAQERLLVERGVLKENGREHFTGMLTFPIPAPGFEPGESVVNFYARRIEDREPKHLYLPGEHRGLLNARAASVYSDGLILLEKVIDFATLWRVGIDRTIPCFGTSGFTPLHERALREARVARVLIGFDNDPPGDQAAERLAPRLVALGIEVLRLRPPAGVKDWNEYFLREIDGRKPGREEFEELVARAQPMTQARTTAAAVETRATETPPAAAQPSSAPKAVDFSHLVSTTDEEAVFAFPDVLYTVTGIDRMTRDALRVVVTAESAGKTHTDRLDLYLSRSRRSFALALHGRLDLHATRVEEDLTRILEALAELYRRKRAEHAQTRSVPPMTADEEREARALLAAPDLLARVREAYECVGVAGEDATKTLAFLVATSRKMEKPLSLILRSSSASGKSTLLEKTVALMPPEETEYLSRLTQAALYYVDSLALRFRLLVVDERAGSAEADLAIRSLQSRREISLAVPMKTPSGGMKTRILTVYGPTAIMESTTEDEIFDENANRAWVAHLDEGPEMTRRVHAAQKAAWAHAGRNGEAERTRLVRLFHNAQRLLQPVTVQIPFGGHLRFPSEWTRTRRDLDRFLGLIAACAFLHQVQRERLAGDPPVILATLADYAIAYPIARDLLASTYTEVSMPAAALLGTIRTAVERRARAQQVDAGAIGFRRRDVREWSRLPDHQVKRLMRQIEDLEYVETFRRRSGASHRYRLADVPPCAASFAELTTPEELETILGAPEINDLRQKRDKRDTNGSISVESISTPVAATG